MHTSPLMGYNHNVRYKSRVYHLQTEDSGLKNPHIYSHVFFKGAIVCSARTDYGNLQGEPDLSSRVVKLMREQHKALLRRLRHGDLDQQIVTVLGSLEPRDGDSDARQEHTAKQRSYRHRMKHADRIYAIQTDYYAIVRTDIYHEQILIASETHDCRGRATPGGEVVQSVAQDQHKRMIKRLRSGAFDDKICSVLGSLAPKDSSAEGLARRNTKIPIERYEHRLRRCERTVLARTQIFVDEETRIVTDLFHGQTLLTTHASADPCSSPVGAGREHIRELAQRQHKELLKSVVHGDLDDTIALLDEMEALDSPTPPVEGRAATLAGESPRQES